MKEVVDSFLEYLEFQKRYSRHTITAYRSDLSSFCDYLALFYELDQIKEVSQRMVSSWVADLADSGIAPRSINRTLSAVQSFYEFAIRKSLFSKNPARLIQRPKTSNHLPSVVRSESIDNLFNEIEFESDFEGVRDRLILAVFYACGLRREELITLNLESIDEANFSIKVFGKRNKERILPIAPMLMKWIEEYLEVRQTIGAECSNLFITLKGQKLYPSLVYQIVKKYLSQVTTMDKKSPHVLRHTFATHLLNEGANLQSIKELLGHSSLAATQVYTHTSLEKLKQVYQNAHPRSKN